MGKINKPPLQEGGGSVHKLKELPDDLVRFSFRHFTETGKFCAPAGAKGGTYMGVLLGRLKDVSGMRMSEFMNPQNNKALRSHSHDWAETTETKGYKHLSKQLQGCTPWQFSLSVNEHGRVHGILIDNVFYVVWLDPEHSLYKKS